MKTQIKILLIVVGCWVLNSESSAFASGAGTCDVVANFSTITGMQSRTRNQNTGGYVLSSNVSEYNVFEHVEITLTATGAGNQATYTGIVISVVDGKGQKVGTFNFDDETEVRDCGGSAMMAATHTSSHGNVGSRTLFWIPPTEPVGEVYVLAYVLSGARGNQSSQEFYRLVRNDGAIIITESDVIFLNSFD
ncbi:hypothetical protein OS175_06725 [Marinicella sp. S1101]|uniref:reeler domain-containing protein n=1 Tax=Marinicella marina TaxID=2996016 RepID=UPI0022608ABF|nr:reeler domain-containing protein [Marinicella marina]MCX7553568.1 hypothetical protein [Marinicella marina]MDJ1140192.1 hypothetical protein [Marinicella marina]